MTPRLFWIVKLKRTPRRHLVRDVDGAPSLKTLCGRQYSAEDRTKSWMSSEFTDEDCHRCRGEVIKVKYMLAGLFLPALPLDEAVAIADRVLQIDDKPKAT